MDALIPILIIAGILVLLGVGGYISHRMEKKRTEQLAAFADEISLAFSENSDGALESRFGHLSLFQKGHSKKLYNITSGTTDEIQISIFDYQYTTGSGKNKQTRRFAVAALESPQIQVPEFSLRPQSIWDSVGALLGFQDINFEDHPEFSKGFVLQGPNPDLIRKVFKKPMLDFFTEHQGVTVEAGSGRMIIYRLGKCQSDKIRDLLAEAYEIYGIINDSTSE